MAIDCSYKLPQFSEFQKNQIPVASSNSSNKCLINELKFRR